MGMNRMMATDNLTLTHNETSCQTLSTEDCDDMELPVAMENIPHGCVLDESWPISPTAVSGFPYVDGCSNCVYLHTELQLAVTTWNKIPSVKIPHQQMQVIVEAINEGNATYDGDIHMTEVSAPTMVADVGCYGRT
jgi:hypothetical protein